MQRLSLRSLADPGYRAVLLDGAGFIVNLALTLAISHALASAGSQRLSDDPLTKAATAVFCLGIVFLQPVGALLKRPGARQRNPNLSLPDPVEDVRGCAFGVYFALQLMFSIFAAVMLIEAFSDYSALPTWLYALLVLALPALSAGNTFLVYQYFRPLKREPRFPFLATRAAERIGDACLFLNMLCFQGLWWYLLADPYFSTAPGSIGSLIDKILALIGMFLFFYAPPRLLYWAESDKPRWIWISMIVSNLPVLFRAFFG